MDAHTPRASIASRVIAGAGWMVAWRMVSRLLGFVSILVLASLLAPKDFGIVAMATAVTGAIEGLSQLGVRDALVRLKDERRDYYDTAFTFQVVRSLLTALLIASLSLFASDLLAEPRLQAILLILAALMVLTGFENIGVVKFSRALDFRTQFLLQAGPRLLGFAITTALAFLLRSYWALIAGAAMAKLSSVVISYVACPHRPRFGLAGWRYLLRFSFWSWAGGLALMVLTRADPFLLGPVLGTSAFGLYVLSNEIASLPVTELLEPACTALFPGFSLVRRGGSDPVAMGLSVAGALALCTIPFSAGISACSGYLVASLLGPQWEAAQPLIAILAWTCMFLPFSWVAVTVLSAQGQVRRVFASHAIAAALKVSGILLVRHTQSLSMVGGAVVAINALESLMFIWQLRAAGNTELRSLVMTLLRAAVSLGVTCAVLSFVPGAWAHVGLGRPYALVAGSAIGGLTFVVFFACQASLWLLCGRPTCAESRIAHLLQNDLRVQHALRAWRDSADTH